MKKLFILVLALLLPGLTHAQLIRWTPYFGQDTDSITVVFDATQGNAGLSGYTGDVYAHTGVITNLSTGSSDWKYVKTGWGVNTPETKLTRIGQDLYEYKIKPNVRSFYAVPGGETIKQIAFVFRSSAAPFREAKTADGGDIFLPLATSGLNAAVVQPSVLPHIQSVNTAMTVEVQSTQSTSLALYIDNTLITQTGTTKIVYNYTPTTGGRKWIRATASNGSTTKSDSIAVIVRPPVVVEAPPAGLADGITYYPDPTKVTLSIYAPYKEFIYLIGDFSNWEPLPEYYMKRSPDGSRYWLTLNALSPGTEYAFQYYVDGKLRVADPYSEKVLDPWNDSYIPALVYPGLKPYPKGKTSQIVSVFQTAQTAYNWLVPSFTKPPKDNLVIYELLLRDFHSLHSYQALIDTLSYLKTLGVNAIELMPVCEFEGNESWGYNPAFHMALDKYYGPPNEFKRFIDKCHQSGIAVILDAVYNHAFGSSPLVRLWWDATVGKPAANSPYFNQDAKHPFSVGYDFNHEAWQTQQFLDQTLKYWITNYKIDGFRFDLSKGFTQTNSGSNVGQWGQYDQGRINLLKRMADKIWQTDPSNYVILEHFADNSEETVLANYGMMLWGKMNSAYNEATMGWHDGGKSDFSWISHKNRGWQQANLVGYMESHDEERLMVKNLLYGNVSGNYNIKTLNTALDRMKLAGAFFFTIPGPKMLWQFGELGYDVSITYPCGTDACRTDKKPIKWDYYANNERLKLYKTYSTLINLKKNYPAFRSNDFTLSVNGAMKRINIYHSSMNIAIVGNFDVVNSSISANFPSTGKWYNYFANDSMTVSDQNMQIALAPGEFRIYTNVKLPAPEPGLLTDVENTSASEVPTAFALEQNYPNPFNPVTSIEYGVGSKQAIGNRPRSDRDEIGISQQALVSLKVYDMLGREVTTLVNEEKAPGTYQVTFDASTLSSGVYFYKLQAGNINLTKKLVVMK